MSRPKTTVAWALGTMLALCSNGCSALADLPPGFNPRRHLRVEQVRPGMTGYGLTVFQGTTIEPFPVTVLSVERGYLPGKSIVWIRCTDPRMQKFGPVQGMSGSPIFLWTDEKPQDRRPGHGGRMIGAFALGFPRGKDCIAGVQPIEQMLDAATRAPADGTHPAPDPASPGRPRRMLQAARHAAADLGIDPARLWRLNLLEKILDHQAALPGTEETHRPAAPSTGPAPDGRSPGPDRLPLALPVRVGSPQLARMMRPFLAGLGLQPVAAGAGGLPPGWLEGQKNKIRFEPGSVLAVPMVLGEMDMAAIGTVTEVLEDGTVLGFGHAMYGQGPLRVPMATGFVHFVQPNLDASFKMGGTLAVHGALVNDENAAVVGKPDAPAVFRPATVQVQWPDRRRWRRFDYQLAQDRRVIPLAAAYTLAGSLIADAQPPEQSTLLVQARLRFAGDRRLTYRAVLPRGSEMALMAELPALLDSLTENPFQRIDLLSMDSTIQVVEQVRLASLSQVHLAQRRYEPGQSVHLQIQLLAYRGRPFQAPLQIDLPRDLPEGKYEMVLGGADLYGEYYFKAHPEQLYVRCLDDLFQAHRRLLSIQPTGLYAMLLVDSRPGLHVGRSALPRLPSSRRALLEYEADTQVGRFTETLTRRLPLDYVVDGRWRGRIEVYRRHDQPSD